MQGTSGWCPSPSLSHRRVLSLSHPLWTGWGRLLPSRVGCEARDEEYWVVRLQEGRGGTCQLRGAEWDPRPPGKRSRLRGERS